MDPIEVEAKVIDTEVEVLSGLDKWVASIEKKLSSKTDKYKAFPVTDLESHKVADSELKAMGRDLTEIENERKMLTRPLDDAKRKIMAAEKRATKSLTDVKAQLKANDDAYKEMMVATKRSHLEQTFKDAAPDLAEPLDGSEPLVSFDTLVNRFGNGQLGKKWMLFSTPEAVAEAQLMDALSKIAEDERIIDEQVNPEDLPESKAAYFATLDVGEALRKAQRRKAERERVAALEAERREREEWMKSQAQVEVETVVETMPPADAERVVEAVPAVETMPLPASPILNHYADTLVQPAPGDAPEEWVFYAYIPTRLKETAMAFFRQHGIHGRLLETKGKRYTLEEVK